jgi:hypothetical protein
MFHKSRFPGFQSLFDLCWKFYCLTGNHLVICWISTYFNQHPPGDHQDIHQQKLATQCVFQERLSSPLVEPRVSQLGSFHFDE